MTAVGTTDLMMATGKTTQHHGFFDGFVWDTGGTVIAAAAAAVIAVVGYSRQRRAACRAERADLYAQAIAVVEDYLEAPYRIRREDGTAETRRPSPATLAT